ERLEELIEELTGRSAKSRARIPGLNPDRADSVLGGALVVAEIARQLRADSVLVSSRGLREGLALGGEARIPSPAWVRRISIATLGARFATWNPATAD